jgi:hypothetical protein
MVESEMQPHRAPVGENEEDVEVFIELGEMVQVPLYRISTGTLCLAGKPQSQTLRYDI